MAGSRAVRVERKFETSIFVMGTSLFVDVVFCALEWRDVIGISDGRTHTTEHRCRIDNVFNRVDSSDRTVAE